MKVTITIDFILNQTATHMVTGGTLGTNMKFKWKFTVGFYESLTLKVELSLSNNFASSSFYYITRNSFVQVWINIFQSLQEKKTYYLKDFLKALKLLVKIWISLVQSTESNRKQLKYFGW